VILGSRSAPRTVTESAVPIDVISMKEISSQGTSKFKSNFEHGSPIVHFQIPQL
jgi:hypothetical protein